MMSISRTAVTMLATLILVACAASPPVRKEISAPPPLDPALARIVVGAGTISGVKLWSVKQVGPVYLNGQQVGATAKDEYFVVDIKPGAYEATCQPSEPEKNLMEKRSFNFAAGETSYLVCTQASKGAGGAFGLIGALASEYMTSTFLEQRTIDPNTSKLVEYTKRQ